MRTFENKNREKMLYGSEVGYFIGHPEPQNTIFNKISTVTDYANTYRLEQDHPCVIEIIRREYLTLPSPTKLNTLNLKHPEVVDPSAGQSIAVLTHLKNKVGGSIDTHIEFLLF